MNDKKIGSRNIVISELTPDAAAYLMKDIYFWGSDILRLGLTYNFLVSTGFNPRTTRLVAFDYELKTPIGFLCLKENSNEIFSIEKVFVHQNYRKMGIATLMFDHALEIAKKKNAKKICLVVYPTRIPAIKLYEKLGFQEIGCCMLGQGYLRGVSATRLFNRFVMGQGWFTKLSLTKSELMEVDMHLRRNREKLLSIYTDCVGQKTKDFFDVNLDNLITGSRHFWQPSIFRSALINNLSDSFAFIFSTPFSSKATVELYFSSQDAIVPMLENLLSVLRKRGIGFTQISLFNPTDEAVDWFKKENMMIFNFVTMGKVIN